MNIKNPVIFTNIKAWCHEYSFDSNTHSRSNHSAVVVVTVVVRAVPVTSCLCA